MYIWIRKALYFPFWLIGQCIKYTCIFPFSLIAMLARNETYEAFKEDIYLFIFNWDAYDEKNNTG